MQRPARCWKTPSRVRTPTDFRPVKRDLQDASAPKVAFAFSESRPGLFRGAFALISRTSSRIDQPRTRWRSEVNSNCRYGFENIQATASA
jgi:hypothetical protein